MLNVLSSRLCLSFCLFCFLFLKLFVSSFFSSCCFLNMACSLLRWAEERLRSTNIIKSFFWKHHNNRHSLHNYTHTNTQNKNYTNFGWKASKKKTEKEKENLSSHTFPFRTNKINKLFLEKYSASNSIIYIFLVLKLVGILMLLLHIFQLSIYIRTVPIVKRTKFYRWNMKMDGGRSHIMTAVVQTSGC